MIVFELACVCGYTFEGWFQNSCEFENQQASSQLVCPKCAGNEIRKILSPIRFQSTDNKAVRPLQKGDTVPVSRQDAEQALETLQRFVGENFEDVGVDLTKEALKIHYGVSEPRNIRGVTTESEEKKLKDEGINILKIPMPLKSIKSN